MTDFHSDYEMIWKTNMSRDVMRMDGNVDEIGDDDMKWIYLCRRFIHE